jgi:hypothetical protein
VAQALLPVMSMLLSLTLCFSSASLVGLLLLGLLVTCTLLLLLFLLLLPLLIHLRPLGELHTWSMHTLFWCLQDIHMQTKHWHLAWELGEELTNFLNIGFLRFHASESAASFCFSACKEITNKMTNCAS